MAELGAGCGAVRRGNLGQRLPRSLNGDEVDRMAAAFNAMAARLEQSFQQIREFTLHASHELKTPPTVMRSQIQTSLAQSSSLPEAQRAALENLHEEVQGRQRLWTASRC
jgi:signal transduction histidine kinase